MRLGSYFQQNVLEPLVTIGHEVTIYGGRALKPLKIFGGECAKFTKNTWKIGPTRVFLDRITSDIKGHEKLCKFNLSLIKLAQEISPVAKIRLQPLKNTLDGQKEILYMTGSIYALGELVQTFRTKGARGNLTPGTNLSSRVIRCCERLPGNTWAEKTSHILFLIGNFADTLRLSYKYNLSQHRFCKACATKLGEWSVKGYQPFLKGPLKIFKDNVIKDFIVWVAFTIDVSDYSIKLTKYAVNYIFTSNTTLRKESKEGLKELLTVKHATKIFGHVGKIFLINSEAITKACPEAWKGKMNVVICCVDIATQCIALCAHTHKVEEEYKDLLAKEKV